VLTIDWAGQTWELLADKALYWPARRTLIVADLHLGKAASFRALGVPVPRGSTAHDLARLDELIHHARCARLIVLGDLLHARGGRDDGRTMSSIEAWRRRHAGLEITLVRGNHDAQAGDPPPEWRIACCDRLQIDRIALQHDAAEAGGAAPRRRGSNTRTMCTIAGHVHPCVRLVDADGSGMRAPCFAFSDDRAILPAFGSFTGTHPLRPRRGDRIFAIGGGEIIEVAAASA